MSLPYQRNLIPRAKELRKNATKEENHLWYDFLRHYPIRFQRQKTIGGFIVDFYCHAAKLVIELDGSQHYTQQGLAYDQERTAILQQYGIQVLRFSNRDINTQFREVCDAIHQEVEKRLKGSGTL
ncbi:MAG TPA: endonuclease domain-containing protein [Candidatus Faecousia faecipullorum]|nr:endonuclease domain-containing protein [Candidatus Faecousia faecipullorum]